MPDADARAYIASAPERYSNLIGASDGHDRRRDLEWTTGGYVCLVADSLRVWSERLANVALGDPGPVADYNQDALAAALLQQRRGARGAVVAEPRGG
jgi:hypothetical protein